MSLPPYVYLNALCAARTGGLRGSEPACVWKTDRGQEICADGSKYKATICRFDLCGSSNLPLLAPLIKTGQSDVNLTSQRVGCTYTRTLATSGPVFPSAFTATNASVTVSAVDEYGVAIGTPVLVTVPAGPVADAGAIAAAWQGALVASGHPGFSACTVAAGINGRITVTGNAGMIVTLSWVDNPATDVESSVFFGGAQTTFSSPGAGSPFELPNAAGLTPAQIVTSPVFTAYADVRWVPQDTTAITPAAPTLSQDWSTGYYWGYSFGPWLACIDTAFDAAWASLQLQLDFWTAAQGYPTQTIVCMPPRMSYDGDKFAITADARCIGTTAQPNTVGALPSELVTLALNSAAAYWFSSFPGSWQSAPTTELDFVVDFRKAVAGDMGDASATKAWVVKQEAAVMPVTSPVAALVLITSSMGVRAEIVGEPTIYNALGQQVVQASTDSTEQMLTDVSFLSDVQSLSAGSCSYAPSKWRWQSLGTSPGPIRTADLALFWRNAHTGKLIPVRLSDSGFFSAKMLLQLKTL